MSDSPSPVAHATVESGEAPPRRRFLRTVTGDLHPVAVLVVFVLCRLLIAWIWMSVEGQAVGDLNYYWSRSEQLAEAGLATTMREYPTPMVWLLAIPLWLGEGEWGYYFWFIMMILVADLAFCTVLWLSRANWRGWGIVVWSLTCLLLGSLSWLRFDLIPTVFVGAALLLAATRPAIAGGLLAAGTATKLWPGVLFPLLLNRPDGPRRRSWVRPTLGFAGTGVVLVVVSVLTAGERRLLSPLVWQSERGLQIESLPATVLMVRRALTPEGWTIEVSRYQAFELFGPGVERWLTIADILTVIGVVLGLALLIRHWLRRYASTADWAVGVSVATLAIICLLIVTNKTLSPQYIIWLGSPVAVLLAVHRPGVSTVPIRRWVVWLLVIAGLTYIVFPTTYELLAGAENDPVGLLRATVVLAVRNALLVVFTVDVLWQALRPATYFRESSVQPGPQVDHRTG